MTVTAIIVDDAANVIRVLSDLLESKGVNVVGTAFDGKGAVEIYKKTKPDVILLDVIMPNYDGIYALKEIRKIDNKANVIMVTADLKKETAQILTDLEASSIIYKPFDAEEMIKIIEKVTSTNLWL